MEQNEDKDADTEPGSRDAREMSAPPADGRLLDAGHQETKTTTSMEEDQPRARGGAALEAAPSVDENFTMSTVDMPETYLSSMPRLICARPEGNCSRYNPRAVRGARGGGQHTRHGQARALL